MAVAHRDQRDAGVLTTALVTAAQAGDRRAFAELYSRYAGMVHSIALAYGPPQDADDIVQDVFLRALRKIHTVRDPLAFGAWLVVIARNVARTATKRSHRGASAADPDTLASRPRYTAEARSALDVVRSLPKAYRETLLMRLVHGMTGPEIATCTGLTPASVRVNLYRGMKLLRQRLGPAPVRSAA